MHWIQAKKSHEDGQPIHTLRIVAVHDDGQVKIEGHDLKLTLWYHDTDQLRSALRIGGYAKWKPQFHVLAVSSSGSFNLAALDEVEPCVPPIRRRPTETTRQFIDDHALTSDARTDVQLTRKKLLDMLINDAQRALANRETEVDAVAGAGAMRQLERTVILDAIDRKWREHLYAVDYLKEGIGLRAIAQHDPLVEYQREGYDMFIAMLDGIKEDCLTSLFGANVSRAPAAPPLPVTPPTIAAELAAPVAAAAHAPQVGDKSEHRVAASR